MPNCAWCRRPLAAGQSKSVPRWVSLPASVAMAFMHGGLWAQQELARPYCSRCRRRMIFAAAGFTALTLTLTAIGAAIWLRRPN